MKLFLIRHAKAEKNSPDGSDAKRVLTAKGKTTAFKKAEKWRKRLLDCDLLLTSPYDRARETAEIFAAVLKKSNLLESTPLLAATSSANEILKGLRDYPSTQNIALFGHGPWINELLSLLVCGHAQGHFHMKKPCFAEIKIKKLIPHGGTLTRLL